MPQSSKHSAFLLNVDVTHNSTVNQININQKNKIKTSCEDNDHKQIHEAINERQ